MHLLHCYVVANFTNCTNGDIRLVGGANQLEGRVEVCYDNLWGTVCSNYYYSNSFIAKVACGQLGFANYGSKS